MSTFINVVFVIALYVASVVLVRWMNKVAYRLDSSITPAPIVIWLFPVFNIVIMCSALISAYFTYLEENTEINPSKYWDKFTGKNWKSSDDY